MTAVTAQEPVSIRFDRGQSPDHILCVIEVSDHALTGHGADLEVICRVEVKDSRAVNEQKVMHTARIASLALHNEIMIPRSSMEIYTYHGEKIDIRIQSQLKVDTGILFDRKISREEEIAIAIKPSISTDAKEIVDPTDTFDFVTNFRAIPFTNKIITAALMAVAAVIIGVNTLVGVHDEFAPDPATYFYDHVDSDGDSESPFMKSLMGSGLLGGVVWLAIRKQLKKYMSFELANVPPRIGPKDQIPASWLLRGTSRVPLEDAVVRIVACNYEKGQYKRGSGTKERTVSFSEPVRAVVLYEEKITLPPGVAIDSRLNGVVRFEPMFRALYPPLMTSRTHGISVHWEAQLLQEQLVDQELAGPVECFDCRDFMDG